MASRSLSDLSPVPREKCLKWLDACKKAGIDVLVYCTHRDGAEQNELYKVGRTVKGANASAKKPMGDTVTNARAGESWHQHRCAWDAVALLAGKPQWGDKATYGKMGVLAASFGIEWAGNWKGSLRETAHFQYTGGLTLADLQAGKVVS